MYSNRERSFFVAKSRIKKGFYYYIVVKTVVKTLGSEGVVIEVSTVTLPACTRDI